ncbi:MAG: Fe-S-containing hydro-lyase [Candidatus Margulisiibacteriota bacterium]|nr:MAG: fumarate hydratase [Candidatus Margulisbacteria bacterium GWD2_39_127]OGI02899.1 MAG: fumarate hydratase [Candidatus Margulisbacteria bacterium GWF2_38_17]OGI06805.1 MAG: fumarate hydratase [Candidatus Margulisbacteria bacterium GWE2_39_32]PZM82993.1 MAG: Fe-S-containing hydro-lyase [Candidatus Margulisiibacteriota bacterium]HAR62152.1 Fe-S-containing hydro-lyase [Candidatus Margulisiibacteriota bacterium]
MSKISAPLTKDILNKLRAGEKVFLSGTIFTARDAAHKKLIELIESNKSLPFELKGQIIYYVGPTPKKPGQTIGSAGPTTSCRMDAYTPALLDRGLAGMIGKGNRNHETIESIKKNKAVYFTCIGGTAALISSYIKESTIIAFHDLGPEAIHKLVVEDLPLFVTIDSLGNNLYQH